MRVAPHSHAAWLAHMHLAYARPGPERVEVRLVPIIKRVKARLAWLGGQRVAGLRAALGAVLPTPGAPPATADQVAALEAGLVALAAPPDLSPITDALTALAAAVQALQERPVPAPPPPVSLAPLETALAALESRQAADHAAVLGQLEREAARRAEAQAAVQGDLAAWRTAAEQARAQELGTVLARWQASTMAVDALRQQLEQAQARAAGRLEAIETQFAAALAAQSDVRGALEPLTQALAALTVIVTALAAPRPSWWARLWAALRRREHG